jgi:hypothetical protein
MKFIDGLRDEFCAAILLHRPNSLDTAFVLAQLQEEVYDPGKRKELRKPDYSYPPKPNYNTALFLASPPYKIVSDDKRNSDITASTEEKWQDLWCYRRAKGL